MFRSQFKKFGNYFSKYSTTKMNIFVVCTAPIAGFIYATNNPIKKNKIGEYEVGKYLLNGLCTTFMFTFGCS